MAPTTRQAAKRSRNDEGETSTAAPSSSTSQTVQASESSSSPPPAKRRSTRAATKQVATVSAVITTRVATAETPTKNKKKTTTAPRGAANKPTAKPTAKANATVTATPMATATAKSTAAAKPKPKRAAAKKSKANTVEAKTLTVMSAGATMLLDSNLMDLVTSFLPVPQKMCWKRRGAATAFIKTIASVCRVLPRVYIQPSVSLTDRYGPRNQLFWREKLFTFFDFSTQAAQSVEFTNEYTNPLTVVDPDPSWVRHRQARASYFRRHEYCDRENYEEWDDPEGFPLMTEDLQCWIKLHVYFRKSHYGFLTEIQSKKRALSSFPDSINAYELFQDLAFLVDKMRIHAVDAHATTGAITPRQPRVYPCLLRRMPKKVTARGSDLLDVCGLAPPLWNSDMRMVSTPWPGLSPESQALMEKSSFGANVDASDHVLIAEQDGGHDDFFGAWTAEQRTQLEPLVRAQLCDWRHVRFSSTAGPQFYIGKRRKTNRWIGFALSRPPFV